MSDVNYRLYDFIIIDAMGLFHRNNQDTNNDLDSIINKEVDGELIQVKEKTSGVYGFLRTLAYFRENFQFVNLVVAWDGGNQRRKTIYPFYKANRIVDYKTDEERDEAEKSYENMKWQTSYLQQILTHLGICQVKTKGEEADDIIASLCRKNKDSIIGIFSNDKDMQQLISDNIDLLKITRRKNENGQWIKESIVVDRNAYKEEYEGMDPSNHWQLQILTGDSADNIPGIKGCGEVSAFRIMKKYGSVRGFLETPNEKLEKLLRVPVDKQIEYKKNLAEIIDVNEKLVRLVPDVKTTVISGDADYDERKAEELCRYLQFESFFDRDNKLFMALQQLRFRDSE